VKRGARFLWADGGVSGQGDRFIVPVSVGSGSRGQEP
jgi:hypothetical protein